MTFHLIHHSNSSLHQSHVAAFVLLTLLLLLGAGTLSGQTNPAAFDLSSGNYSFTSWASSSASGTYPANMIFHVTATQDPTLTTESTGDYTGAYNGTSGTRMNGLDADGFSFINTGTSGFLGAAVLALNTTGRENVQVSWTGGTVVQNTRIYRIRLQYRIGTGIWTDVPGPIEYEVGTAGTSQSFGPTTLPSGCNNQSAVYLRWKYYFVSGSSARPQLRVDEISVSSSPAANTPTGLAIVTINGGNSPSVNTPFTIVVQSQNNGGSPTNVVAATGFTISVATGTGTLSGTMAGELAAGTNNVTVTGLQYGVAETGVSFTATRTYGDVLSAGTSAAVNVLDAASKLAFVGVPPTGQTGTNLTSFTVEARRADDSRDLNFAGTITIAEQSGSGIISGTLIRSAVAGIATFDNIQGDQIGAYTLSASSGTLTGTTSTEIRLAGLTDVLLPQYIEGINGTNANRLPYAFRVRLAGLLANATYRYFNQIVISSDASTSSGSGNSIFAPPSGDFVRTTGPGLSTAGTYGTFVTDATGEYEGWFVSEPTGNARFIPGHAVFMRISLNDGAEGTTVALRLTTHDSVKVAKIDVVAADSAGTGLRGASSAQPKDFVFMYDNESGSGRPISGTFVESDGTANTTGNSYAAFYANSVNGVNGSYGVVVPNTLPNGVRRVERRALSSGTVVASASDADGVWPSGANTVNPAGGGTEIVLTADDVNQLALPGFLARQTNIAFGNVPVTGTATDSITIVNTGEGSLHIAEIASTNSSEFDALESGPMTVPAGDSTRIHVSFHPTTTGLQLGSIVLTHNATGSPDSIALQGTGVVASIVISPRTLGFGSVQVGDSKTDSMLVTNPGGAPLSISSIACTNTPTFLLTESGPITVQPGESVYVHVAFHPTAVGSQNAGIVFIHNGTSSPDTATISGTGVVAGITIAPTTMNFGSLQLGLTKNDSVLISNSGGASLIISALHLTNLADFGLAESGPITVAPGGTVRIHLTYHPAAEGATSGLLMIDHNAATVTDTVALAGRAIQVAMVLPRIIQGISGTNSNRIPFAYRAHFAGLIPDATYRYFNQVVISTDALTSSGSGNCIFVSSTGSFVRTSSPGLATAGSYGAFTADAAGLYDGWFITEPTGNARFVPGHYVFMRVSLNDGGTGATVAARFTSADSVRVVQLATAGGDTTGTGLRCTTQADAHDFVFVYDDTSGMGRPLSGTFIESDGTSNTTGNNYATFYANSVDGVNGAFGLVVPNNLPAGVRRVERRALATGLVTAYAVDTDGIWPSGSTTVNPSGGTTEIVLTGSDVRQLTGAPLTASLAIPLAAGWNMISNPVTSPVPDDSVVHLFPTSVNRYAFAFDHGYVQQYQMQNGKGYWAKFPALAVDTINGTERSLDSIAVMAGWNMVGSISAAVDTGNIVSIPAGIRASSWFAYAAGYSPATQLVPGNGYWIKASEAGVFVLSVTVDGVRRKIDASSGDLTSVMNSVTITDRNGGSQTLYFGTGSTGDAIATMYAMPPLPPQGAFDARFESSEGGCMVQNLSSEKSTATIALQTESFPIIIQWNLKDAAASYSLSDGVGGKAFAPTVMKGSGSITISNSAATKLSLTQLGIGQVPSEFALAQNYPNPFNPTTTISYALPVESNVTLEIYDVIGRRVRTLVSAAKPAGYYRQEWNGANDRGIQLSSGVYFARISANGSGKNFTAIRKLMMTK